MIVRVEFTQTTLLYSAQFSVLCRLHGVRGQPMWSCNAAFINDRYFFVFRRIRPLCCRQIQWRHLHRQFIPTEQVHFLLGVLPLKTVLLRIHKKLNLALQHPSYKTTQLSALNTILPCTRTVLNQRVVFTSFVSALREMPSRVVNKSAISSLIWLTHVLRCFHFKHCLLFITKYFFASFPNVNFYPAVSFNFPTAPAVQHITPKFTFDSIGDADMDVDTDGVGEV